MKSFFIERLINRTIDKVSVVSIKPAITPEVVPESFLLPEQQFIPFPSPSSIPSEMPSAGSLEPTSPKEPRQVPKQKTSIPLTRTVSEATPTSYTAPVKTNAHIHDAKARNIESKEESKSPIRIPTLKKKFRQTPAPEKTEKTVTHTRYKTEGTELKEPTHISAARSDLQVSERVYTQTQPREEKNPEKINRHVFSPTKSLERHPHAALAPKPAEQNQTELSVAPPRTHPLISTKQSIKQSQVESEPTVTISIGRIEVQAVMPQKPATKTQIPVLSLKDYIKQRSEGTR